MGVGKENLHLDLGAEKVNPVSGILDLINVALLTFFLQECTHFLISDILFLCKSCTRPLHALISSSFSCKMFSLCRCFNHFRSDEDGRLFQKKSEA